MKNKILVYIPAILLFWSCTFNYGDTDVSAENLPDLVMENVEYVRVRAADPLAKLQAERFERYDKQNVVKMQNITFEQYGEHGEKINVYGRVGSAEVNIESGDIFMDKNVSLDVKTEDILIDTYQLEWKDEPRFLSSGENNKVNIYRENGTRFSGTGLQANTRLREWEFLGGFNGVYIYDNQKE